MQPTSAANYGRKLRAGVPPVNADLRPSADPGSAVASFQHCTALRRQTETPLVFTHLFAIAIDEAAGGSLRDAMPVSVMSSLWWAIAEGVSEVHLRSPVNGTGPLRRQDALSNMDGMIALKPARWFRK